MTGASRAPPPRLPAVPTTQNVGAPGKVDPGAKDASVAPTSFATQRPPFGDGVGLRDLPQRRHP
eukprot:4232201-Lingulodinium_polyedra.AAC.1